ncbi:MAG TPA: tetratricopeptide repeat protein, partial [Kofleriaceae bacterium]|nr:tetratricopeptide repeat protein [Kofleriaceae bacterium]
DEGGKRIPDSASLANARGLMLVRRGRLAAAFDAFERAAELDPDDGAAHTNAAAAALTMRHLDDAETQLRAIAVPAYQAQIMLGVLAAERNDAAGARGHYRAALALEPARLEAGVDLALASIYHEDAGSEDALARHLLALADLRVLVEHATAEQRRQWELDELLARATAQLQKDQKRLERMKRQQERERHKRPP